MSRVDEAMLAQDIAVLRGLIDRLLDDERPPDDLRLVAASMLLKEKLGELQAYTLEERADTGSGP